MNYDRPQNGHPHRPPQGTDFNLSAIFQIFNRGKYYLIFAVLTGVLLATVFNYISDPVYETSTIIKKENNHKNSYPDEFQKISRMQSPDEIHTEIEILKSRTVVEKAVDELDLFFKVNKISIPGIAPYDLELHLAEYDEYVAQNPLPHLPRLVIGELQIPSNFKGQDFYITVLEENTIALYDGDEDRVLQVIQNTSPAEFKTPMFRLSIEWPQIFLGSWIYFSIQNPKNTASGLEKNIAVAPLRKTNLFKLSVQSSSPYMAQLIANNLTENFRETRLEHKRNNVSTSFDFVDEQLKDISRKLNKVESDLSDFKSKHQISTINNASNEVVQFLSNLETERIKTNLELGEYRTKHEALKQELAQKGFFDQTYLTPNGNTEINSPFSQLLRQLASAEIERLELLQKRTVNHPNVREVDSRIAELKNKLSSYNQNTITAYSIIINSLQNKHDDLQSLISKYEYKLGNIPRQEVQLVELMRKKNVYEKMFNLLLDKREEMRIAELSELEDITIVDPAMLPLSPVKPRKKFNLVIGFVLGMMVGLTLILVRELRNRTIQDVIEIENKFQLPILAILPQFSKDVHNSVKRRFNIDTHIAMLTDNHFGFKESYRVMRTKLGHLLYNRNILQFTSCEENTGKTTVVTNFAVSLAMADKKVLLIDCDLRRPKVGEFFHIPRDYSGLIDFLGNPKLTTPDIYSPFRQMSRDEIKLHVIPAGGSVENSSELLDTGKFKDFLESVSDMYDYIFIDTPPTTKTVDSMVLGKYVEDVVVVVRPGHTNRESFVWGMEDLKQFEMNIIGLVINGCDMKMLPDRYRYGYQYGYGYEDKQGKGIKSLLPPN